MKYLIIGVITFLVILCAVCAISLVFAMKKELREKDKELKEAKENAQKTADAITEANKTKADARTGDRERDINYMADKLHEYASK